MRVAVVGLGLMGGALAEHLLDDGHDVTGYDPDPARGQELAAAGGAPAPDMMAAVGGGSDGGGIPVDVIVLSLPDSSVMLEVCSQLPALDPDRKRPLVIDTTTGDPEDSIEAAARLARTGWSYLDATISGNAGQAAERDIIFMVGGHKADVARARPIIEPLGRGVHHVGPVGAGARAKLVVNHVLAINRVALAEGLVVAEKAGIDLSAMLDVLRSSAAHSRAVDLWGERMVTGEHGRPASRIGQGHKDARLIVANAEAVGASRRLVGEVEAVLAEAEEAGLAKADQSAVIEVLRRRAGIGRVDRPGPAVWG